MHDEWNTDADWGTGGGNWGEDAAQQPSASSFDMSDLQELLNSVSLAAGAAPAPAHKTEAHRRSQPAADLAVSCVETPQQFPQFFLCFESEPLRATVKDSESIQKLVDQYQASEAAEVSPCPSLCAIVHIRPWLSLHRCRGIYIVLFQLFMSDAPSHTLLQRQQQCQGT